MRRFIFRLETVLRHRETIEGLREQEFVSAQGHLQTLLFRLTTLRDEFARIVSARPGKAGESFDAGLIFDRERYLQTVQAAIDQQERRVETAQIVAEEKRAALLTARQAREAVSQLREQEQTAHMALAQKLEQDALDEMATLRYIRANSRQAA